MGAGISPDRIGPGHEEVECGTAAIDHYDPGRDALIRRWQARRAELKRQTLWLSPEKRDQLIEDLEEQHQQQLEDWAGTVGTRLNGVPTQEDQDRLQKWQQDFDEAEKQLLTSEELAELQLHESDDVADCTRPATCRGLNRPDPDGIEVKIPRRASANSAMPNLTDEERTARQNELQANFDSASEQHLSSGPRCQYQLANNDQYQALHNVTQRYGLPDSVATQSLDVQQSAQTAAQQVRANSNLSPEAQQAALNAIQQETNKPCHKSSAPQSFLLTRNMAVTGSRD